jgi:hypothetical protein
METEAIEREDLLRITKRNSTTASSRFEGMASPINDNSASISLEAEVDHTSESELVVDFESIPGCVGAAVLHSLDGSLARPCMGELTEMDASILYQMLSNTCMLLERETLSEEAKYSKERLRRITVSFSTVRYSAAATKDGHVYIIKTDLSSSS